MGKRRGACREREGRRPIGRPRCRWENIIIMDLQEMGWRAWTGLVWFGIGTGGGAFEHGNEPSGSIKCGEFVG
jgi:hypothetical protein